MIILNKTLITQLNNSIIDCSYINKGTTEVVTIETPNSNGDDVIIPFIIRTKDGFNLKYDKNTGNVVFRFNKPTFNKTISENELITNYSNYFDEYNFNLINLSTYENVDPVTEYKPRYSDNEVQNENIFILKTDIVHGNKPIYIASYYGNDPKKCKLELICEVFTAPFYDIKTQSGKMFMSYKMGVRYGSVTNPYTKASTLGTPLSNVVSISVNAEKVGAVIEEDNIDGLFTTYVVNQSDLKKIASNDKIYSEIIINTYSYPIKFVETDLLETNIVLENIPIEDFTVKRFKRAELKTKIFSFNVPYLKDVENCMLLLPFNPEIILDYDIIRGKIISGFIQYEVSTNSTTLYIDNGDVEFYKTNIVIETSVPFKPTVEHGNFIETEKRLGKQVPTLLIKCLQEEKQKQFIQGIIEYPIEGILKDELELLNTELQKGVITNE